MVKFARLGLGEVFVVRFEPGERVPEAVVRFANEVNACVMMFYGIGGFRWARLGVFREPQGYYETEVRAPSGSALEVASLIGSVIYTGKSMHPHIHVTLGTRGEKGLEVYAGHLIEAEVYPLLELFIFTAPCTDIEKLREVLPHRFG